MRERPPETSMVYVIGGEDVLAVDGGDLHFRELKVAMAVNILPGLGGDEGDFVWARAHDAVVLLMPGTEV